MGLRHSAAELSWKCFRETLGRCVGCNFVDFLGEICKWPPYTESKDRVKKHTGHCRLVGGRFNKWGNLHRRFVLGGHRRLDLCTRPPGSWKFTLKALTGFSHTHHPDGLNNTLLVRLHFLEQSHCGNGKWGVQFHGRGGVRSVRLPGSSSKPNSLSRPPNYTL